MTLSRSRGCWFVLIAFALVAIAAILLYVVLNPADRVTVTITRIDPSTRLLCLIAETPDGPEPMRWSITKVFPSSIHPSFGISGFDPRSDKSTITRKVLWREGTRYGVLTRDKDDKWQVFWFEPEDVSLEGMNWWSRDAHASIRLPPKALAEPVSNEYLDRLGFDSDARESWRESP